MYHLLRTNIRLIWLAADVFQADNHILSENPVWGPKFKKFRFFYRFIDSLNSVVHWCEQRYHLCRIAQRKSPPTDRLIVSTTVSVNQWHGCIPATVSQRLMVPSCHCSVPHESSRLNSWSNLSLVTFKWTLRIFSKKTLWNGRDVRSDVSQLPRCIQGTLLNNVEIIRYKQCRSIKGVQADYCNWSKFHRDPESRSNYLPALFHTIGFSVAPESHFQELMKM